MRKEVCIVPAHVLKGLLKLAPKHDVRFYLNGIFFDVPNSRLVATDGNAMLLVKRTFGDTVKPFIVPRDLIESALKLSTRTAPDISVAITQEGTALRVIEFGAVKGNTSAPEIDAKYPDYARTVPIDPSGEPASYNPVFLANMQTAIGLVRDKENNPIEVVTNGRGPALVATQDADVFGVCMPWNVGKSEGWATAALQAFGFKPVEELA